jgi:oxygen-dependent protoporphyrinogen oxidase
VRIGLPATLIERASEGWRVSTTAGVLEARALVFAAPAHVATSVFAPLDSELSTLCGEVPYVSTASVAVAWPRAAIRHPLGGSGFVVARRHSDLRITACTWVSSKWPGRAPAGMVLLRAFIGGASDPDAVDLDDDALVDVAVRDMSSVLGIEGPPRLARVFRWRNAGAQHNVGQLTRMQQIESRLAQWPGLYVAGSGFRSIGIPDCVADGRAAADAAIRYARMTG